MAGPNQKLSLLAQNIVDEAKWYEEEIDVLRKENANQKDIIAKLETKIQGMKTKSTWKKYLQLKLLRNQEENASIHEPSHDSPNEPLNRF